jgi:DNA polymerase-4
MAIDDNAAENDGALGLRKIVHIDMDAFFASVEQRDDPALRGKPLAVGFAGARGVVAAASYEARVFGVRSAMPSVTALRLCPQLLFVPPRFDAYKAVSGQIRAIFRRFTPLVEPLSLDEAYLDVTDDIQGIGSATRIAELIRTAIRTETGLTASAGVSYNKFLAKLASDQNKPDGLCVIRPGQGSAFVAALPVRRFHGVGPRGAEKLAKLGIETGADLAAQDIACLRQHFGSFADYLFRAARGIDLRPVQANRKAKSIGGERTFDADLSEPDALRDTLERIIAIVWDRIAARQAQVPVRGKTVVLKLKYNDFRTITRSRSVQGLVDSRQTFARLSRELLEEALPLELPIRLLGLTLSNFEGEAVKEPPRKDGQLSLL